MPVSPVPTVPGALTDTASFVKRFPSLATRDPEVIAETIVEASAALEDLVDRRLAPFTGLIYEDRLFGIDPQEYGSAQSDLPMSFSGSIGMSYADALGANDLIRHFWLPEYAPRYPELWTYTIESMNIFLTYGNSQAIPINSGGISADSPGITDGHVWLRLGTFAPEGTRIQVTYSGGYTVAIPPALKRAALYQTAKFLMLDAEPQQRGAMSMDEIDAQITRLMAPWARA